MAKPITRNDVRGCVERAGMEFDKCWEYLCDIKFRRFSGGSLDCLTQFQTVLAEALLSLNRQHRRISREKKRLIAKKDTLDYSWFSSRMKLLADHQRVVRTSINVGLSLGDAFALFFYRNNPRHLSDHLKEQRIELGPTGIGAIGEIEFIRNTVVLQGYFIVFHGITTALRLGDVSLIDLETFQVAGLGEIKSHSTQPGVVQVQLNIIGPGLDPENFKALGENSPAEPIPWVSESLIPKQKARFKRQMTKIVDSLQNLHPENPKPALSMISEYGFDALEKTLSQATSQRMAYEVFDDCLLICAFKSRSRSWWGRISRDHTEQQPRLLEGIEEEVKSLFLSTRKDNALLVDSLYYSDEGAATPLPGMMHPLWWPIDITLLKEITFLKTLAITIYNPAHLVSQLEADEYRISGSHPRNLSAEKKKGGRVLRIDNLHPYMRMMQRYLYPKKTILEILRKVENSAAEHAGEGPVRIDVDMRQIL